jgi:hypothetical protein
MDMIDRIFRINRILNREQSEGSDWSEYTD